MPDGRIPRVAARALILLLPAACSYILDSSIEVPDEAEITVTGSSPVPLRLVMSSRFIGIWNPQTREYDVTLNAADTVEVSSPPISRNTR